MNEAALRLSGVKKTYNAGTQGEVNVLDGVDLAIAPGEVVGLVAPSGAGKSTLLHICGLLDTPSSGEVFIAERNAGDQSDRVRTALRRTHIGFVYQFHHLLPEFSALENIILPQLAAGASHNEAHERATVLLRQVDLTPRAGHRPAAMSGGEQQRVALCRALSNGPAVLLADEPTGNLDPRTSDRVFENLVSIARQTGLAALIATHNLELSKRMDRTLELQDGRVFEL